MREIVIDCPKWDEVRGWAAVVPVKVGWPELMLTETQILVNAIALADGYPVPYPDLSIFSIMIRRPEL